MLILGESYEDHVRFLQECIATSRRLIKESERIINEHPDFTVAKDIIRQEKQYINDVMDEITELARWRIREGLAKNQAYSYPSQRKNEGNNDTEEKH